MSIADQITRISAAKAKIAVKLGDMELADRTAPIQTLAQAIEDIVDRGVPDIKIEEGKNVTLEPGYYHGGSITGINNEALDSVEFNLQPNKNVTPNKKNQTITKDEGYYGLAQVTVNPIPSEYQNVSQVNATAADVLAGKRIVSKDGDLISGEMRNNGAMALSLNLENPTVEIAEGYYHSDTPGANGSTIGGTVSVAVEDDLREVTPTNQEQTIRPDALNGYKFLLGVKVKADEKLVAGNIASGVTILGQTGTYTDDATVGYTTEGTSPDVLEGKTAYAKGQKLTGSLKNRGVVSETIDGLTKTSFLTQNSGYYSMINVTLSNDIETELAKI